MQVASGTHARSSGDTSLFSITGLPFNPHSFFFLYRETGTLNANFGYGILADSTGQESTPRSYFTAATGASSSTYSSRNQYPMYLRSPTGVQLLAWQPTITSDGCTIQMNTVAAPIEIHWWALDVDAAVGVLSDNRNWVNTADFSFDQLGAAFVAKLSVGTSYTQGQDTGTNAYAGLGVGDATGRQVGFTWAEKHNQATMEPRISYIDTDEPGYVGVQRIAGIFDQPDAASPLDSAALTPGPIGTLTFTPSQTNVSTNRRLTAYALGERNTGKLAYTTIQLPATPGAQQLPVTGLGIEAEFVWMAVGLGATTVADGDALPPITPSGMSCGFWGNGAQFAQAHVQNGDAESEVTIATGANILIAPTPMASAATITLVTGDGFTLDFSAHDGTPSYAVIIAFGIEGVLPEDEIDGDPVTLGWTSQDVSLSSTQTLDAESSTLAWNSQEVDITSGTTLDVDPVTLGWSSLEAALESFSVVDGVASMFNWTAELASITVAEEVLDVDPLTLAWVAQEADVIPAGVVGPEPLTLAWSSGLAGLVSEEQALSIENALLSFASQTAVVLDDANVVSPSDGIFAWMATDVVIANEQVNPEACAFGWTASNANIFPELEERHAHTVDVVRPDSMTVEVYSTNRRTKSGTT